MKAIQLSIVKDSFEQVAKKQKLSSSKSQEVADQLTHEIEQALANIESTPPVDQKSILAELNLKLKSLCPLNQLEPPQKELTTDINRYLKLLEKTFFPDLSKAYINNFDHHTVNQIIATHFYQQGLFDFGDRFITEARVPETTALRPQFLELHQILDAIKVKNLDPALKWVSNNREKLRNLGSTSELKIHKLKFAEILKRGNRGDTLSYAKTHLSPLASRHMKEIQKLTVSICWIGKLESCPHSELLDQGQWAEVTDGLIRDFCDVFGQSYGCPLTVALTAGIEGLPTLLKLVEVMSITKQEWRAMGQLPVPVELRKEFQFHSVFVCPVSREKGSEDNPPMLLPCMHVVCKQAIGQMSKGCTRSFNCPLCPSVASFGECKQLYF